MEVSLTQEIKSLALGAPVSHLLDVMVQAKPYMQELGDCARALCE